MLIFQKKKGGERGGAGCYLNRNSHRPRYGLRTRHQDKIITVWVGLELGHNSSDFGCGGVIPCVINSCSLVLAHLPRLQRIRVINLTF